MSAAEEVRAQRPLRIAVLGVSTSEICGVRDHAGLLAQGLADEGLSCSWHWLDRHEQSLRRARAEITAWTRTLSAELERERPHAIVLHYSVFSYSHRGIPVFVRPILSALSKLGVPLILLMHEFAYPLRRGGLRGTAWAISHRAVLVDIMRASRGVIVTTDFRADWLKSRRWLPQRPMAIAPVFSNLPPPLARPREDPPSWTVGLFGYSYARSAVSLVLDAIGLLADRGLHARLVLLGAPGRSSGVAEEWLAGARARALTDALSFSGALPAQELSDALASCEVLLFADPPGPTSRKTTLAASLASGRAVVALDGRRRWSALTQSEAARVVPATPEALAGALELLMRDDLQRAALGVRGRAFAERHMSVHRSATTVTRLIDGALESR